MFLPCTEKWYVTRIYIFKQNNDDTARFVVGLFLLGNINMDFLIVESAVSISGTSVNNTVVSLSISVPFNSIRARDGLYNKLSHT